MDDKALGAITQGGSHLDQVPVMLYVIMVMIMVYCSAMHVEGERGGGDDQVKDKQTDRWMGKCQ